MIRPLLAATIPAIAILFFAYGWLAVTQAHGAECRGVSLLASWYGPESGNRTATGAYFDGSSLTAAMPSRKHLGERWRISYRGKSVVVTINDVGPAKRLHRGIDLARAAARRIGFTGVGRVCGLRLN